MRGACVGVYQLLNRKMHGETLNFLLLTNNDYFRNKHTHSFFVMEMQCFS